jgi:tetratricopeptide (TPR) repeat protein
LQALPKNTYLPASTILCTYCSYEKDRNPELISSIRRYKSTRISYVYELSIKMRTGFRILSGEYGLISADEKIPWYDHPLMREEVDALSKKIADQLRAAKISAVIYYTKDTKLNPVIQPYLTAIEAGCFISSTALEVKLINGGNQMSNWLEIMKFAEAAKNLMISNRAAGEGEFIKLLEQFPADGMVFLKRGQAFEVIGEYSNALADYEKAEILFPMEKWIETARTAAERIKGKIDKAKILKINHDLVIDYRQLNEIFSSLRRLLRRIEKNRLPKEELYAQIARLESEGLIPTNIVVSMHTLRKYRNLATKEDWIFAGHEAIAIKAAWSAIIDWAGGKGYQIDDLYRFV